MNLRQARSLFPIAYCVGPLLVVYVLNLALAFLKMPNGFVEGSLVILRQILWLYSVIHFLAHLGDVKMPHRIFVVILGALLSLIGVLSLVPIGGMIG